MYASAATLCDETSVSSKWGLKVVSDIAEINGKSLNDTDYSWSLIASDGWKEHIEK